MKLTDSQLVLLSAASQREDGIVEIGPSLKGGASRKVIGKLLSGDLIEEISAQGSLPVWRRDPRENAPSVTPADRPGSAKARQGHACSVEAGQGDRHVARSQGGDRRGRHEGDRLATAFGGRLLRRRGPQEA